MKLRTFVMAVLCVLLLPTARAAAQTVVLPQDTLPPADTIPREAPSPRNAFLRAMVVPGWGHFGIGEYRRGAVYLGIQATSWAMLAKSINRLDEARDMAGMLERAGRDSLALAMAADTALARELSDPLRYERELAEYPGLQGFRDLANARRRHRQDWIVYTTVFTFAAAIDAYVTAHLKDFPEGITVAPAADGGVRLGLQLPLGTRR
jgi:hypothetical protein